MINSAADVNGDNKPAISGSNHLSSRRIVTITLLIVGVAVSCWALYNSAYPFQFLPGSYSHVSPSPPKGKIELNLDEILQNASMGNKTVIITTLNQAWAEPDSIFDLFLESFHIGNGTQRLLNHLVVVSLDQKAYSRCLSVHPHCYALNTEGVNFSTEAYFMNPDYLEMMWIRIDFLTSILKMGYNFVFTDTDIMWLRDPFPHFYPDSDFQIACDHFFGNSSDKNNQPNGGFNYVKSNQRTIQFYKFWYSSRRTYPGQHDQDVLNKIKYDTFITKIGLKMRFLDTAYYGGFCEPSNDFNLVCTMHANCCFGQENKIHDLKIVLEDWKRFLSLPPSIKALASSSWSVPQNCRYSLVIL